MADFDRVSKTFSQVLTFTRPDPGTYYDAQGVLQTAAVDEKRLTHDPETGEALGLLIEEQRTNLLLWSEAFDNAVWNKVRTTVSGDLETAPDGTVSADKLVEDTVADATRYVAQFPATVGETYAISVFAKAAGREFVYFAGVGTDNCVFNLSTGAVIETGGWTNAEIKPVGDGWFLCSATVAAQSTGAFRIGLSDGSAGQSYTGDGTSGIYVWGVQLEAGSFPTSYIKTEGSQVTRSADNASVDTLTPWFNPAEFTLFSSFKSVDSSAQGYQNPLVVFKNTDSRYGILPKDEQIRIYTGDDNTFEDFSYAFPVGDPFKVACSFDVVAGIGRLAVNGQIVNFFTVNPVSQPVTTLGLSEAGGANFPALNKNARFIPRALTAAELEELTAP